MGPNGGSVMTCQYDMNFRFIQVVSDMSEDQDTHDRGDVTQAASMP